DDGNGQSIGTTAWRDDNTDREYKRISKPTEEAKDTSDTPQISNTTTKNCHDDRSQTRTAKFNSIKEINKTLLNYLGTNNNELAN
ncbi:hypothetical protein RUND412_011517, partial [Rhizina undulata]